MAVNKLTYKVGNHATQVITSDDMTSFMADVNKTATDAASLRQLAGLSGGSGESVPVSKSHVRLSSTHTSEVVTVSYDGSGTVSAVVSDPSVASVSVDGNSVTIGRVSSFGDTEVTVSVSDMEDAVITVACTESLNDCTWAQISQVARSGKGELYFDIGDVKMITLNGKIGDYFTADNLSLGVFILDINHPMNKIPENNIIFGGFRKDGYDVALQHGSYNNRTDGTKAFNFYHTNYYEGSSWVYHLPSWVGTDFRYDILGATSIPPSCYLQANKKSNVGYDATEDTLLNPVPDTFLSSLPSELRSKIRLWKRYVSNVAYTTSDYYLLNRQAWNPSNIVPCIDAVTVLAESEMLPCPRRDGYEICANFYEYEHNTIMSYYAFGNPKEKRPYPSYSGRTVQPYCLCSFGGRNAAPSAVAASGLDYYDDHSDYEFFMYTDGVTYQCGLCPAFKI